MVVVRAIERGIVDLPSNLNVHSIHRRLLRAGRLGGQSAFEERNGRLCTLDIVGVVDVGKVVVEIVPKSTGVESFDEGAAFLRDILRWLDRPEPLAKPSISLGQSNTLFESVLAWAAQRFEDLLVGGMPRRYSEIVERTSAVKGRIIFSSAARNRPGQSITHTIRHAPLGPGNPLTDSLLFTAQEMGRRTASVRTRARCARIAAYLSEFADGSRGRHVIGELVLARREQHWGPVLELGKALVNGTAPDPVCAGSSTGVAMLYTLKDLFESTVRKVLKEGLVRCGLRPLKSTGHLLTPLQEGASIIRYKPDFGFAHGSASDLATVGDAKWKRIISAGGTPRLTEADAYQITSYLAATGAESGFIVAPIIGANTTDLRCVDYLVSGIGRTIRLIGVDFGKLVSTGTAGEGLRSSLCQVVTEIPNPARQHP